MFNIIWVWYYLDSKALSDGLAVSSKVAVLLLNSPRLLLCFPGPEPSTRCELSPINASHPVQALMESFTVLSGCASRGTTGLPREVHVLNLRSTDQGPGQRQREVSVGIALGVSDIRISFCEWILPSMLDSGNQNSCCQPCVESTSSHPTRGPPFPPKI